MLLLLKMIINKHMENYNIIPQDLVEKMITDRKIRTAITKESHWFFFHFYFAHYVKYATADFQRQIISLTENESVKHFYVVAFRGSGKSTIVTTSFPIWSILGKPQKKFILILTQTKTQAKQHMMNMRRELESNQLLKDDLWPYEEENNDEWGSGSIVFKSFNARITVASTEQSIRGLRHGAFRPDLIICDDVEDIGSTKTREGRNKTYNWFKSEVIPCGDKNTRVVVIGNLLHEDSLLMRIKEDIKCGKTDGTFLEFPLTNENNVCLWPGKYPTAEDIEIEKKKVGSEIAWQREYLLRIIPSDDQIIYPEWIQYYDELPGTKHKGYRGTYAGVDLAISAKDSADFTTIVSAHVYSRKEKMKIYILPNPIEQKLNFPAQVDLMKNFKDTQMPNHEDTLFVESVAYQEALPQMLELQGVEAEAVKPKGDKRTRLSLTSTAIKSGIIKFPRHGCENLIRQLVGFGVEKHDDLADAFSLLINSTLDKHSNEGTIIMFWLDGPTVYYSDYVDVD